MEATSFIHAIDDRPESMVVQEAPPASRVGQSPVSPRPAGEISKEVDPKQMEEAATEMAEKMNQVASVFNTSLSFSVDKPTGKTVIKVMDTKTDELIRQIPPKEVLKLIGRMRNVMGMLLDLEI